jgi:hypothetical protein
LRDDTSPENVVGDTPSDSGLLGMGWNVDNAWFGALGDARGGFEGHREGNSYLVMGDAQDDINYAQQQ